MIENHQIPDLYGLVLAGGKSERMGQAKAHISVKGEPLWKMAEQALLSCCSSVYFSVSSHLYPPLPLTTQRMIEDVFKPSIGPLGGIISAFKSHPTKAFLVMACDLAFFDSNAVKALVGHRNPQKKATVFLNDGKVEPLCGIYEPQIFPDVLMAWAQGRYCPRAILKALEIERVEPRERGWLRNCNRPEDLEGLMAPSEKNVSVHYYAALREQRNCSFERMSTSARSVGELFSTLKEKYALSMHEPLVRYAKNDRVVLKDEPLNDGDEVVFMPPVSGG